MKNFIPNALTALNLVLGMFAIIATLSEAFQQAALFIVAAMIADGLDGRVARYFNASSEFGKELDSLCDLVSFGVAPAILAYKFFLADFGLSGSVLAAAFATCGALRLARFNVNTNVVKGYFMGLPIPAGGCVLATFVMIGIKPPGWVFPLMVAVFAYLMVSTVRYPDFKGKGGERVRVIPLGVSLLAGGYIIFAFGNSLIFAFFFTYVLLGILNNMFRLVERQSAA
ncbi:MAG TPA: CDP-diacylglycerol--serine O-phosphatidyltransferase [Patescibacteria group bacterium]|nr:CDP-diacylglycerol--serine O-phosphatidyltransferase [Patescibacteria group bacterium]